MPQSNKGLDVKAVNQETGDAADQSPLSVDLAWSIYGSLFLACLLPLVVAYQLPPQPTFVNQWIAGLLWSVVLAALVANAGDARPRSRGAWITIVFWVALTLAIATSALSGRTPTFIALPALVSTLAITAITFLVTSLPPAIRQRCFAAICAGLFVAAVINAVIALTQWVAPLWHDDRWIAALQGDRVYGNLRQPNLLALMSLLGLIAAYVLLRAQRGFFLATFVLFSLAVLASDSRAGMIGLVVVIAGFVASQLLARFSPSSRTLRTAIGVLLVGVFVGALLLYQLTHDARGVSTQHRVLLWQNVFDLIAAAPLTGVGFGQLNFAWTLTPFATRAPDVFDHAHNFALQWAVEFGIPVAALLCGLLGFALYRSIRRPSRSANQSKWPPLAMIAVALIHSMVEFPLWFLHFLLPLAAVFALVSAEADTSDSLASKRAQTTPQRGARLRLVNGVFACVVIAVSIAVAAWYWRGATQVTEIYANANSPERASESAQLAATHATLGHYGDYALIMLAELDAPLSRFSRTTRSLIDERLLLSWARAYERSGDWARANFLYDRAREFASVRQQLGAMPRMTRDLAPTAASMPLSARDFR